MIEGLKSKADQRKSEKARVSSGLKRGKVGPVLAVSEADLGKARKTEKEKHKMLNEGAPGRAWLDAAITALSLWDCIQEALKEQIHYMGNSEWKTTTAE